MASIRSYVEPFLAPAEWLGEILFGLIMVLTISLGAGIIIAEGPEATRKMLQSMLGCIFAWSLIDAMIFAMNRMFERSRTAWLIEAVQKSANEEQGLAIIQKELEPRLKAVSSEQERVRLYRDVLCRIKTAAVPNTSIQPEDLSGALVTFLLVMFTAVPAIVPFLFINAGHVALRVSNGLLLVTLFFVGVFWAREAKTNPRLTGLCVMLVGMIMVGIAKVLGG
jgi:hypothetical protein